ncbi:alpha/beta hydrolase [Catellatospora sp. KI3]|uniref:alpha/beta hydrolase family protein n=1 Tax=Catellatospora sp. KI3 TaxID=3041620 RepID=UPI00248220E5|nr:alpha/beta hydrolase [Catellatospora sp. KI3]MDI1461564.1 alpha/beta hydrolase [Catellatospora sp. KI3]
MDQMTHDTAAAAAEPQARSGPVTARWNAERDKLDAEIAERGVDWDQPRSIYWNAACGPEAGADFAAVRARVRRYADFAPTFEAIARRREARAAAADAAGDLVTSRDNHFMAALHWGAAQWPIHTDDDVNRFYHRRKRDCYRRYAELADHRMEPVTIPFEGHHLPAWFHLPPGYTGGRIPTVIAVPGMDSFKEATVSLYGDRFLSRGFAVLAMEGPGQYEARMLGLPMTVEGWTRAGTACVDWLLQRPEVDPDQIVLSGISFGSFAGTLAAAYEPRLRACAVMNVCHQPGWKAAFGKASPTYKMRFMYMSGHEDEAEFDRFAKTLDLSAHVDRLAMPYLVAAGERDELSPIEHTRKLLKSVPGPKRFVVYQDSRHSIGGVPSTNLGPFAPTLVADWLAARLRGEEFTSEEWFIDTSGKVTATPLN